ncbi:uncharacterized protein VTP21DRAFT_7428 [Calcarisporiella thermophila]|uniref:uncharacterized protein n=1 Tax=Calcarisporiella thermophila TaxID=911321 RepID=UPI0037448258
MEQSRPQTQTEEIQSPTTTSMPKTSKRKVILAYDSSPASQHMVEWAIQNLIQPEQDHVIVATVYSNIHIQNVPPFGGWSSSNPSKYRLRTREAAEELVEPVVDLLNRQFISNEMRIIEGDPASRLPELAVKEEPEVLLVGSRNLGQMQRTILKSVSDRCVRESPCSVIVVKSRKED